MYEGDVGEVSSEEQIEIHSERERGREKVRRRRDGVDVNGYYRAEREDGNLERVRYLSGRKRTDGGQIGVNSVAVIPKPPPPYAAGVIPEKRSASTRDTRIMAVWTGIREGTAWQSERDRAIGRERLFRIPRWISRFGD
ncbi:PREDICTED: uncharacterized protein LOC105561895 [Vollenhovia emeryi]|uniref:uncharacterized protein LOC105561895 n=1 Tax=Vollenhovia emeryi TaxID=411798 RepID=UPI0005F3FAD2|nr:PREDICTED: uncharacterized protein LOC105561895 [Vollenhovia emeryi]